MATEDFSNQLLNGILSCFENLSSIVFWVCDPKHEKQIYLNKGFEAIWGRPKEFLYNNPRAWADTLLPEDYKNSVVPHWNGKARCYASNFRIIRPNGNLQCISSSAYTLVDNTDKPIAVAGIDELILPEQWHEINETQQLIATPLTQAFINLLQTNFNLVTSSQPDTASKPAKPVIRFNEQAIAITKREKECLDYLLKGLSTKQIAYELDLSTRTVEKYLDTLRKRLNCRSQIELLSKIYKSRY